MPFSFNHLAAKMKIFILVCTFLTGALAGCHDELGKRCVLYKQFCNQEGLLGDIARKRCQKTCGICHEPILASGNTFPSHVEVGCHDELGEERCKLYKQFCKIGGILGDIARKRCQRTCGICRGPTLAPNTTLPCHIGGCGKPDVKGLSRVVGGKTATPHSWPWQILMFFEGLPICGGTLIAPQWVVTAAHCVYRRESSGAFSIRVGEHDRQELEGSEVDIKVAKVFRHESYDPIHLNNDIAMFKLEHPVKFNKFVSPACLPKANVPSGSKCYITGWGKTHHPGTMTRYLQQGILPVVTNEKCYEKNHHRIPVPITDAMICGGSGGTERTSGCHGDSGGPFVCEVDGVWELHGSVSHGSPECKSTETYTVFSRTFHFLDWIKKNMDGQ